jgi:hypothetical protein
VSQHSELSVEFLAWAEFLTQETHSQPGLTWSQEEACLRRWTFSKNLAQQLKSFFQWREPTVMNWSLGQALEKLWRPEALWGLQCQIEWPEAHVEPAKQEFLQKLWQHWQNLPPEEKRQAPTALLLSADVADSVQGAKMGEVLRSCYWAQLEGVVKTRDQALDWARKFLQK